MEHQPAPTSTEPTFERTVAEEALLIAARLQQERRDRLSLSELKRTAAEVDIDPEFVEQALSLMKTQPPRPSPVTLPVPTSIVIQAVTCLSVTVVQVLLARLAIPTPILSVLPVWGLALLLAGGFGALLPRGKDATRKGLAYIALASGGLLCFFVFRRNVASYYANMEMERVLLLFLAEAGAFVVARQFRRASVEVVPKPVEARGY